MNPRTQYANLTLKEFIQLHRWDIQGDELVEEMWQRLESAHEAHEAPRDFSELLQGLQRIGVSVAAIEDWDEADIGSVTDELVQIRVALDDIELWVGEQGSDDS